MALHYTCAVPISDDAKHPEISPSYHLSFLENSLNKKQHKLPLSPLYVNKTKHVVREAILSL